MIRLIEALKYRSLRYIRQSVGDFQLLVGPNGSGKSSFLDVVNLTGEMLRNGLGAVTERSPNFLELVWLKQSDRFELTLELEIPKHRLERLPQNGYRNARYELAVGLDGQDELTILGENLWLKPGSLGPPPPQRTLFPSPLQPPSEIVQPGGRHTPSGWRKVVTKKPDSGNDYFMSETSGWNNPFRLGPRRLALANLPEDEERFPVATWVKRFLLEGVDLLVLNSEKMRRPSAPGGPREFQTDGSNLAWVIETLKKGNRERFDAWLDHLRTALPDVRSIDTVEREEDRHRYLRITYATGLEAPSWVVSDGTLRLLALTLIGYLEPRERVYLIEEPENGIHPQAAEVVFQALESAYGSQILCATHSPVILALADPEQIFCFSRDATGATDVVRGSDHPRLRDWKRETDLGTLFATGVLG